MALDTAPQPPDVRQRVLGLAQQMADAIARDFCTVRFNVTRGKVRSINVDEVWHVNDEELVAAVVRETIPGLDVHGGVDE